MGAISSPELIGRLVFNLRGPAASVGSDSVGSDSVGSGVATFAADGLLSDGGGGHSPPMNRREQCVLFWVYFAFLLFLGWLCLIHCSLFYFVVLF